MSGSTELVVRFQTMWESHATEPDVEATEPDVEAFVSEHDEITVDECLQVILVDLLERHRVGRRRDIEAYLSAIPQLSEKLSHRVALIVADCRLRTESGAIVTDAELIERFPEEAEIAIELLSGDEEEFEDSLKTLDYDGVSLSQASIATIAHLGPSSAVLDTEEVTLGPSDITHRVNDGTAGEGTGGEGRQEGTFAQTGEFESRDAQDDEGDIGHLQTGEYVPSVDDDRSEPTGQPAGDSLATAVLDGATPEAGAESAGAGGAGAGGARSGAPRTSPAGDLPTGQLDPNEATVDLDGLSVSFTDSTADIGDIPERIGRYDVLKLIGEGGFGGVFLARDGELDRLVAIKVARPDRIETPEDAEQYLAEARIVANLDHPHIVPVHDLGRTDDGRCFVVSKFVEGEDLAEFIKTHRPTRAKILDVLVEVAIALDYGHQKGVIHRDVKPGNILVDQRGTAYVIDFGVALKQEHYGTGAKIVGTPAYMSPEQARGEGHLVDQRSDVFCLGVVLYEVLTGTRPFRAGTMHRVLEKVCNEEPKPPRQRDPSIPRELERICLKAMSKRAADRYDTAAAFADDLRLFRSDHDDNVPAARVVQTLDHTVSSGRSESSQPVRVVPKGLHSFGAEDADFFLALLPGSKDRDGLPASVRFWKNRIEGATSTDADLRVGLIYGPSGCGKSSLIKAGLLPQLGPDVLPIYIEASPSDTEGRLLNGLRKRLPNLRKGYGLVSAMSAIRKGNLLSTDRKIVIFIDQFEQWLHAHAQDGGHQLRDALRQCDGANVQCILMIRDDFWLLASRFMQDLEIDLVEGQNMAMVDLFDKTHAQSVLTAFGRAYGQLPSDYAKLGKSEEQFVEQAVEGLAVEGKVISVRLALFAEMIKSKPWTVQTLRELGGAAGVGVTFLDETFTASNAPPEHRIYSTAARQVLAALLPEEGAKIKGRMRSYDDLKTACGYVNRSRDFDRLLNILDTELRLISPTAPDNSETDTVDTSTATMTVDNSVLVRPERQNAPDTADSLSEESQTGGELPHNSEPDPQRRFYQLTHDYLVPALRQWLTIKQQETAAGRAELTLAERGNLWNARREKNRLPSLIEWFGISVLTDRRRWTEVQRDMMRAATKYYAIRSAVVAGIVLLVSTVTHRWNETRNANELFRQLDTADAREVTRIVDQLEAKRHWADDAMRKRLDAAVGTTPRLRASLVALRSDGAHAKYVVDQLGTLEMGMLPVVADELLEHADDVKTPLWEMLEDQDGEAALRLRSALVLARLESENSTAWEGHREFLVRQLIDIEPSYYPVVLEMFRPIRKTLIPELHVEYRSDDPAARKVATSALLNYAEDQPEELAEMVADARADQFLRGEAVFRQNIEPLTEMLNALVESDLSDTPGAERETESARIANAGAALIKMGRGASVWRLLEFSKDPRIRTQLIHRFRPFGVDSAILATQLRQQTDVGIREGLWQAIGEYPVDQITEREDLIDMAAQEWREVDAPGLHSSIGWAMRSWGEGKRLDQDHEDVVNRTAKVGSWYIAPSGQTMVVVDGRGPGGIGRILEVATTEVSRRQMEKFIAGHKFNEQHHPTLDCPAGVVTWFQAVMYCQWLNEQENIPPTEWCYPPREEINPEEPPMMVDTSKIGYRLPTDLEWQFACRGGTVTNLYFGMDESLFEKYAWLEPNSQDRTWPGGLLKPNSYGLFDTIGNLNEWRASIADWDPNRVSVGGLAWSSPVTADISFYHGGATLPNTEYNSRGLRIVRTHRLIDVDADAESDSQGNSDVEADKK